MDSFKQMLKKILLIIAVIFYMLAIFPLSAGAELNLTGEERDYIARGTVIRAASIDGGAPLHYIDSKGEIKGIAVRLLDEIADISGLNIEYKLYSTIDEAFKSNPDILFGITTQYAPAGMMLSRSYLKTEAILFYNSSLDPSKLEDKIYAAIKGGNLPEGISEENTIYYPNREETLNAVERGKADYGYGNAYSVAFYMLQNGYKNIVSIPKGRESREYCIGYPKENEMLFSIINKSIEAIDENQMQTLILDVASHIDRKITFPMIMDVYGRAMFGVIILIAGLLFFSAVINIRANNRLKLQNWRYEVLSQTSNECLYEYHVKADQFKLSKRFIQLFGAQDEHGKVIGMLKKILLNSNLERNISNIKIPLANGQMGVFRAINSRINDNKGNTHYIIGKLIDISKETAEKKELIAKSRLDGLTGLYNAATARQLITKSIKNRDKLKIDALIIMDCDNFKYINDTFGHLKGDRILENISTALKLTFRQTDIIGRIGGDEFCVYMKNIPSVDFVQLKCCQLSKFIQELHQDVHISVSIGIAFLDEETTYEKLFTKADEALYSAKQKGKAQVVVFSETNGGGNINNPV